MRFLKNRSIRFYLGFFLILVLTIGGSAFAAFADSPSAQVAVQGQSSVSEGTGTTTIVPAATVTLDGTDKTATYQMQTPVNDDTGSGQGWYLTITSTTFSTGNCTSTGHNLLNAAGNTTNVSTITGASSSTGTGGTYTPANNSVSYTGGLGVPAACNPPNPVVFYDDTANHGMGHFTLTASVNVSILANAYAGTYSSTLTVALIGGQP